MKFCKDCAHYVAPKGLAAAIPGSPFCSHERGRKPVDLVSGARRYASCAYLRQEGEICGYDGNLFEPKSMPVEKQPWWRLWAA